MKAYCASKKKTQEVYERFIIKRFIIICANKFCLLQDLLSQIYIWCFAQFRVVSPKRLRQFPESVHDNEISLIWFHYGRT